MNITFLGTHNLASPETGFTSLLIDDVLALDAGGIVSCLSFGAQRRIEAVLLTHQHYDHVRDVPSLAMSFYVSGGTISVYGIREVREELTAHLLDGRLYPNFLERPPERPTLRFAEVSPYRSEQIAGYSVLPVPTNHLVPAVGYQVTSPEGRSLFYTGDAGPGLAECWPHLSAQLLIVEVTLPNELEEPARAAGHLTPALLKTEMLAFQQVKGYLPQTVTVHMNPDLEDDIAAQLGDVAEALNHPITLGYEGMVLSL